MESSPVYWLANLKLSLGKTAVEHRIFPPRIENRRGASFLDPSPFPFCYNYTNELFDVKQDTRQPPTMKLVFTLSLASGARAFLPPSAANHSTSTELSAVTRRKAITLASGVFLGALAGGPDSSHSSTANPVFEDEINYEPSQQAHGDLLDVNNAFVVRCCVI